MRHLPPFLCPQQRAGLSGGAVLVVLQPSIAVFLCPQQRAGLATSQYSDSVVWETSFHALNNGLRLATAHGSSSRWVSTTTCFYALNSGQGIATSSPTSTPFPSRRTVSMLSITDLD